MKKYFPTILGLMLILTIGGVFVPHFALAATDNSSAQSTSLITSFAMPAITGALTYIAYFFLQVSAWFIAVTATFLSISMNLTTHIKDIYTSVTAIQSVWVTVRDLSSMLIIFGLLYFSILTIVGKGGKKWNELVKNIFLAGILINFSLFFCRVAIDASNLVSLQFYNAIAPNTSQNFTISQAFVKGGISDIFLNSLKIPAIYNNGKVFKQVDIAAGIGLASIGGIILMITAAFSFLAASIAFTARTAILLACMALSPLYFAGWIFPQLKEEVSDKIMKVFKGQLVFMPVYLFLLYVALRVISDPMFMKVFNPSTNPVANDNAFGPVTIGVIIQYVIAIIFINAPLVVAISMSGTKGWGMKWAPNAKTISGFFGQHTFGRAARVAADSEGFKALAARAPGTAIVLEKGLKKASGATFGGSKGGYDDRYKKYVENRTKLAKKLELEDEDIEPQLEEFKRQRTEEDKQLVDNKEKLRTIRAQLALIPPGKTRAEFEQLERDLTKKVEEGENRAKPDIEAKKKELKNARVTKLLESLESGTWVTKKGREEATEKIKKALKKSKKDKLFDAIKEASEEAEEKPKDKEGGGEAGKKEEKGKEK